MNFYYCIKKTVNGTGEDIIGWSDSTSVPTSWGAKTFVYNESSADYKPKRSDFNESFYIGYRWDGSGLLSSSLVRVRYHYITVSYYVPVTSISLSNTSLALEYGDTKQLTYSYLPLNTTDNFTWSSSNSAVATVSGSGLVTAVGSGTATITLKQIQITPAPGFIISGILVNGISQAVTDRLGQQINVNFTQNTTVAVTFDYRRPVVTQTHTRERISDNPGFEKSVVTYSADMDYTEYEIRRTAAGATRGRGIGELLASGAVNVTADTERTFETYYYHLETDGNYIISVYVKNAYGVWSG